LSEFRKLGEEIRGIMGECKVLIDSFKEIFSKPVPHN